MIINKSLWASIGLALILGMAVGSTLGYDYGTAKVQSAWDKWTAELADKSTKASEQNRGKEATHAIESNKVTDDAQISKEKYDSDIATVQSSANDRVRQSEARADKYRRMSEASATEQEHLADYAAGLDKAVSEGQSLVSEYRYTLEQREREIRILSAQIEADRKLTGEANAN